MAKLKEMIDVAGSIEKAELMARNFIETQDDSYTLDLVLLLAAQGKVDEAWEHLQEIDKKYPNNDRIRYNKGWYVMQQGDLLEGFSLMNVGRSDELWGNAHIGSSQPIWDGEPLEGKHLLFYCEAGLGDQIVFVRFVKDLAKMGARVTVSCDSGLAPIFARIPEVSAIVEPRAMLGVYHDYWLPSMYAPVPLKKTFDDITGEPYITPNQHYIDKFRSIMQTDKYKIGIRWLGQSGDDYINRVFDENLMFDAVNQENTKIYSLQKDIQDKSNYPDWLIDMDSHLSSWEDTAGVIQNLDLVITSCTSIAHITSSMGKECWVIPPAMMYFIWCYPITNNEYDISLWYDSLKIFRQREWDGWEKPFNDVKNMLRMRLNEKY